MMTDHALMLKVCDNIRDCMEHYGYSHKDLAEAIGLSVSSFGNKINMINGKFNLYELKKIAEEFYLTLDELTDDKGTERTA